MSNLDKLKHYIDSTNGVDMFLEMDATQGPMAGQKITIFISFRIKDGLYYGELSRAFPQESGGYSVSTQKETMQVSQFPEYIINNVVEVLNKKFESVSQKPITNITLKEEIRKFVDSVMLRHPELTDEERKQMSTSLKLQINILLHSTFGRAIEVDPNRLMQIIKQISEDELTQNLD